MPEARWGGDEEPASLIWRSLPLRLAIAAIPLWLTASVLISNVTWPIKLSIAATLGVSLAAPIRGLLLVAALAPVSDLIAPMIRSIAPMMRATDVSVGEALVVAFLAGWLLRRLPDRGGPRVAAPAAGWLLAAAVVARLGFIGGARVAEGLALVVATTMLFRREPALSVTLPVALAASAALTLLSSALFRGGAVAAADAGYVAMIGCLALGVAMRGRGYRRAIWWAMAGASGVGVWLTWSRGATGATEAGGLGVVGLALFVVWIGAGVLRAARALTRAPRDTRLAGAAAGVMAFLAMRLTGHLPLGSDVFYAFWIQFGLMAALAGSTLLNQPAVTTASPATSSTRGPSTRTQPHRRS